MSPGVGYGVVFVAMSNRRAVVGVDASKIALHQAVVRVRQMKAPNLVDLIRCDVTNMPIRSDTFDACFMHASSRCLSKYGPSLERDC